MYWSSMALSCCVVMQHHYKEPFNEVSCTTKYTGTLLKYTVKQYSCLESCSLQNKLFNYVKYHAISRVPGLPADLWPPGLQLQNVVEDLVLAALRRRRRRLDLWLAALPLPASPAVLEPHLKHSDAPVSLQQERTRCGHNIYSQFHIYVMLL